MVGARAVPRQMAMVGMQRMPGMTAFNIASQAGLNPSAAIPMQRPPNQPPQLRRKDPGMGMQNTGYPQQKRRL